EVLLDAQLAEDRGLLREVAHPAAGPLVHRQLRHVLAVQEHRAAVRAREPDHHVKGGRLAGTVRAEETDHVAGAHLDRDIVHDPAAPEGLVEPLGAEERRTAAVHGVVVPAGACAGAPLAGAAASTRAWSS